MLGKDENMEKYQSSLAMRYVEKAVECEMAGDFQGALHFIDEAYEMLTDNASEQWIIEYNYLVYHYRYDSDADSAGCISRMLELWEIAKQMLSEDFEYIKIGYILLVYHILMVYYRECVTFPNYEEMVEELLELFQQLDEIPERMRTNYYGAIVCAANYYYCTSQYVLAEEYYSKILEDVEENGELEEITFLGLVNLCYVYIGLGSYAAAKMLGELLLECGQSGELEHMHQTNVQRMIVGCYIAYARCEGNEPAYDMLCKSIEDGLIYPTSWDDYYVVIMTEILEITYYCNKSISGELLIKARDYIKDYAKYGKDTENQYYQKGVLLLARFYFTKIQKQENAIDYLDELMTWYKNTGSVGVSCSMFKETMTIALHEYSEVQEWEKLGKCITFMLEKLDGYLQQSQYYIDNDRMQIYVNTCEECFKYTYSAMLICGMTEEKRFCHILNNKNILPSLVYHRDKGIAESEGKMELLASIKELKEQMERGNRGLERYTFDWEVLDSQIRELECEYQREYGEIQRFPKYELSDFLGVLPEHSVVIDCYFSYPLLCKKRIWNFADLEEPSNCCLEIFAWYKEEGCEMKYCRIDDVSVLLEKITELMEVLQQPHKKYQKKAKSIYQEMFSELDMENHFFEKVIISPHLNLANLPFDVVLESGGIAMDNKELTYCQSLRELFYERNIFEESNACIIGNPKYDLKNPDKEALSKERGMHVVPLPYSGYEAMELAATLGEKCYTGKDAVKACITSGYKYIHIATHGFQNMDIDKTENAWYAASLSFAGIIDWMDSGVEVAPYGNGILTAAEIARMNLQGTELVVLSACHSGNSEFVGFEQQVGLHIAFGAAGVRYIVASLWALDDFATAVFMQMLCRIWKMTDNLPLALGRAKKFMKNLSVSQIKNNFLTQNLREKEKQQILKSLENYPEDYKYFSSPYYWAGFLCYQYTK